MNRRSLLLSATAGGAFSLIGGRAFAQQVQITGAGATFPNPVYQRWGEGARTGANIVLNYQSVGSGAGVNQITNRTVDFGATDAPRTPAQLEEAKLVQFPAVMGSIVPIVNLPGVEIDQLRLTGELIADIYMGKITKWNDAKLVEMNRGVTLPNLAIAPVYRADASGTTFVWTSYLSAVSPEWKEKGGAGTSVRWPTGAGARGNEGVAGTVRNTRGAIGYVENAYATQNKLTTTQLRNKAGQFVKPTTESFMAAASSADWSAPGMAASLIDQAGPTAWPVVSPTFILLPSNPTDPEKTRAVMRFFDWAFKSGGDAARQLEYIPLPEAVQNQVRASWRRVTANGQPVWTQS